MLQVARVLFDDVLPWASMTCTDDDLNEPPELTSLDLDSARKYEVDPYVIQLSPTLFCCRQKTPGGKLHKVTVEEAKRVIKLWKTKSKWSYSDVRLLSSFIFTSPDACFLCPDWSLKLFCSHQEGVRRKLQMESIVSPLGLDTIVPRRGRGRNADRKKPKFSWGENCRYH